MKNKPHVHKYTSDGDFDGVNYWKCKCGDRVSCGGGRDSATGWKRQTSTARMMEHIERGVKR